MDSNFEVHHRCIEQPNELYELMRSKYVQSSLGNVCIEVRDYLNAHRQVLFSGTPCQVAALKLFLGREYENLFCMDFVCYGVPSSLVFQSYISELQQKHHEVEKFIFRYKGVTATPPQVGYGSNGQMTAELFSDNAFIRGFCAHLFFRPSCYNCHFREGRNLSDMRVGDFWDYQWAFPNLKNNGGISFVCINSDLGRSYWDAIAPGMEVSPRTWNELKGRLTNLFFESPVPYPNRRSFFRKLRAGERYSEALQSSLKLSFITRVYFKLYRIWAKYFRYRPI